MLSRLISQPGLTNLQIIIKKNINLKTLQEIAKIIDGSDKIVSENVKKLSNHEISCFKFAPVMSCDAERTFSQYKNLLKAKSTANKE